MSSEETTKDTMDELLSAMASGTPIDLELRTTIMHNIQDEVECIKQGDLKPELLAEVLKMLTLLQWDYHTRLVELERWAKQVQDGAAAMEKRLTGGDK